MSSVFQKKFSFDKRKQEANRILEKFPDKIPVIVEQGKSDKLAKIDKSKFLVPQDITVGQLSPERELNRNTALFFCKNNTLPQLNRFVNFYVKIKVTLFMTYWENVFGH